MNKKLLLMCLVGLMSAIPTYAACNGGTQVTGTSGTFCKSNVKLNWWSASAWCKANGLRLATVYEVCPSWDGTEGGECSEMSNYNDGYAWTATAFGSTHAFRLNPGGVVSNQCRTGDYCRTPDGYAFCR